MTASLIYIVGASGSGKDTLIHYARAQLANEPRVCFAHRYITRPSCAGGENHIALSEAEFAARLQAKLFAMHWESHGLHYGIGLEIDAWLARGITVVVNGSRAYLPQAKSKYAQLLPVTIDVAPEVLQQRLMERGREDATAIAQRLARHAQLRSDAIPGAVIANDAAIEAAGDALVQLIRQYCIADGQERTQCA